MPDLCLKGAIAMTVSITSATCVTAAPSVASVGPLPADLAVLTATNSPSDLSLAKGAARQLAAADDKDRRVAPR